MPLSLHQRKRCRCEGKWPRIAPVGAAKPGIISKRCTKGHGKVLEGPAGRPWRRWHRRAHLVSAGTSSADNFDVNTVGEPQMGLSRRRESGPMVPRNPAPSTHSPARASKDRLPQPEKLLRSESMDAWSQDYVLQLQAMAGNAAVQGLFAQSQPAAAPPQASVSESHAFPCVGQVQAREQADLRGDPPK